MALQLYNNPCKIPTMLWAEKYRPLRIAEVVGNSTAIEELKRWSLDWERGKRQEPLLVWGPPGCGKGAVVFALAETMGWEVVEMNASDLRNKASVQKLIGSAGVSAGLFGKKKLIFIDDVDALAGNSDRGGGGAILEVVNGAENPMILTALDFWDQSLRTIRASCKGVGMKRVTASSIATLLGRILKEEKVACEPSIALKLAEMSNGDIRSAINDLQSVAEGRKKLEEADLSVLTSRDRERSVFEAIRLLLKSTTYDEAVRIAYGGIDVDPEMFFKWIEENVPAEYEDKNDLARAFNSLSRADIFTGRIMARQHWGFMRYSTVLATAGVALAKDAPYKRFVKYSFPKIIQKMGASKIKRARLKAIGLKIGAKCHASSHEGAVVFLPLIRHLMEKKEMVQEISHYFSFDEKDVAFLLEKSEAEAEKLLKGG